MKNIYIIFTIKFNFMILAEYILKIALVIYLAIKYLSIKEKYIFYVFHLFIK